MCKSIRLATAWMLVVVAVSGCASFEPRSDQSGTLSVYGVEQAGTDLISRHAPLLAPQAPDKPFNKIGRVAARISEAGEEIYLDTASPAIYAAEAAFTTAQGSYTNLIYRFHFPYVPYSYLTAGKNGGLFVVITLDQQQHPVLITTVHTCGCYLAMVPTSYMPDSAYPDDWRHDEQRVFGERLPGRLNYPDDQTEPARLLVHLRSGNHRVMHLELAQGNGPMPDRPIALLPLAELNALPLAHGGTTSFFHQQGRLKGYVKGAGKPWEMLLMSWWALDLNIGRDKRLAPAEEGALFYTSLKPWARRDSDMWQFDKFLQYWGWRL